MAYFIIPLDLNDYIGRGWRNNWCNTQTWWTNQNIQLSGSSVSPTSARVGDTVSIQVDIQGCIGEDLGSADAGRHP